MTPDPSASRNPRGALENPSESRGLCPFHALPATVRIWPPRSWAISFVILVVISLLVVAPSLGRPVHWPPDALFYQAQVYEVQGESQNTALGKAFSSMAAKREAILDPRVADPTWVNYSAQFYRRRWLVPLLAAAIYPVAGSLSLLYASVAGYVALGLLLFALLRRRFSNGMSLIATAACMLLPPLKTVAGLPMTDSWGIALEIAALLAALLALERGGRWVAVWVLTVLALSFTRDATIVPLVAAAWILITTRKRRSAMIFISGLAAAVPAPVAFGAPLVNELAYVIQGYHVPGDTSWSYVITHYANGLWSVIHGDATYPTRLILPALWYIVAVALIPALGYTLIAAPRRDPFFMLNRGAFVGAALTIALLPNFTSMRLELVFIPCVGVAIAFTGARVTGSALAAWLPGVVRGPAAAIPTDGGWRHAPGG